jgi:hypothetical protein
VDELMALCDRLEESLAAGNDTRRCLLDALIAGALAPGEMQQQASCMTDRMEGIPPAEPNRERCSLD